MARITYVRIGEAARVAGVSVDTLRRWESAGKLKAVRTPGGHRTYRLDDIERLRDDEAPEVGQTHTLVSTEAPTNPGLPVPPWKARQANAEADLAVTRSKIERKRRFVAIARSAEPTQNLNAPKLKPAPKQLGYGRSRRRNVVADERASTSVSNASGMRWHSSRLRFRLRSSV